MLWMKSVRTIALYNKYYTINNTYLTYTKQYETYKITNEHRQEQQILQATLHTSPLYEQEIPTQLRLGRIRRYRYQWSILIIIIQMGLYRMQVMSIRQDGWISITKLENLQYSTSTLSIPYFLTENQTLQTYQQELTHLMKSNHKMNLSRRRSNTVYFTCHLAPVTCRQRW